MFRQLGVKDNLAHVQKVYQFVVIDDEMVQEKANHQWPHMKDEMKLGWVQMCLEWKENWFRKI